MLCTVILRDQNNIQKEFETKRVLRFLFKNKAHINPISSREMCFISAVDYASLDRDMKINLKRCTQIVLIS